MNRQQTYKGQVFFVGWRIYTFVYYNPLTPTCSIYLLPIHWNLGSAIC